MGMAWLFLRNLTSPDTRAILEQLLGWRGFLWFGWFFAFIEIPIAKWAVDRQKRLNQNRLEQLEVENQRCRELLKKLKADEFLLEIKREKA
jgi:hypothetical protein